MPSLKLVAVAKDEAPYLAEWIFHHLYIGVHEIEIYMNGTTDNGYRIMRRISNSSSRVSFVQSDKLLELSLKANQSFQLVVYDHVIKAEQASRRFSHLMFLDIDEYLLPAKFGANIHSLLKQSKDADVISFLWHSDLPSMQRPSFSPLLCRSIWMQKMCQVKSMCRLKGAAKRSRIHTFIVDKKKSGTAIFKLSDGSIPQLYNKRKLVSNLDLDRLSGRFEPWFIYHRVFRSHNEYCASLMQGNLHRKDRQPIKKNRYGYCIQVNGEKLSRFHGDTIEYRINRWQIYAYYWSYFWFARRARLKKLIRRGQILKMRHYEQLKQLIDQHPEFRKLYVKQLRSTQFELK